MKQLILCLAALLFVNISLWSQSAMMIEDINPGSESSMPSAYTTRTVVNDLLLFVADDGEHGEEVWVFDGTDVSLLKDINEGPNGVDIEAFVHFNDLVYFAVSDGIHGTEWWVTDGTEQGTNLFMDINPGAGSGVSYFQYQNQAIVYQGELYFAGASEESNYELWKTDGTQVGTTLVKNIASDNSSFNVGSHPAWFIELKGELLFNTREGLYKSDGTESGTTVVQADDPYDVFGFDPTNIISMGDYALMYTYERLWRSDGTENGTYDIANFGHTSTEGRNDRIVRVGDLAIFPGVDPVNGEEMWVTDGTESGTHIIKDIFPGDDGYSRGTIIIYQGIPHFKAEDPDFGIELWKTDGTADGTVRVTDVAPGASSSFYWPTTIYTDDELIYMGAGSAFNTELWISDKNGENPSMINVNPNDESRPNSMLRFKNFLFFGARSDNSLGFEPHIIDITDFLSSVGSDLPELSFDMFPNPVNDQLFIKSSSSSELIYSIFNIEGTKMIRNSRFNDYIDVSSLADGQYLLKLVNKDSGEQGVQRFTKFSK